MMFLAYVKTSISQLIKNTGRSVLTMLGIIIGIGSVIFIMTTGEVAKNFLLGQIAQFGTNVIEVGVQGSFGIPGETDLKLTEDDVDAVLESPLLPDVTGVSAGYTAVEDMVGDAGTETVSLFGDRPEFFPINNLKPIYGRFFTQSEYNNNARVVVIDEATGESLYGKANAVGERVKIGGTTYTIIGVAEPLGGNFGFAPAFAYVPITSLKKDFADGSAANEVSFMFVEFSTDANVDSFTNRLEYVLRENNGLLDSDTEPYLLFSREQGIAIFDSVLLGIQAFISAVAAISLVVGGIGIMNIMLVTVKERTKEIGLRKAIGAKNGSVLTQFLIESVVLTTVGGLIGIALGLGLTLAGVVAANALQPDWGIQFVFVPNALFLATGVSVSVGIIFGLYPAIKASRLEPIEALRYE